MQEVWGQFLHREDSREKKMVTLSSILAKEISWTEEPGGLQSMGSEKSETGLSDYNKTTDLDKISWRGKCLGVCVHAQSCLNTLCNPMNCSLPGSSVHGILQARILEWVAISFSMGSSQPMDRNHVSWVYPYSSVSSWPRNRTGVSGIAGGFFTIWATRIWGIEPIMARPGKTTVKSLVRKDMLEVVQRALFPFGLLT